jgi:hypothetical protein
LLTKGDNFKTKIAARTEKGTEEQEKTCEICDHGLGFISYLSRFEATPKYLILKTYEILATHSINIIQKSPAKNELP